MQAGSVDLRAFLALESALARTIGGKWAESAVHMIALIADRMTAGDYNGAFDAADKLDMRGMVEDQRSHIEELAVSSLLFGAQQHVHVSQTDIMQTKQIPDILQPAIDQLMIMIESDTSAVVRDRAYAVIEDYIEAQKANSFQKEDLADLLNAAVLGTGKSFVDIGANLTTSRLVSYGFLSQAMKVGVTRYQISAVLDERTCRFCRMMHGKSFKVENELARLHTILMTTNPKELKQLAPFPKQSRAAFEGYDAMSETEFQGAGLGCPPFHPICRCLMLRDGTVRPEDLSDDQLLNSLEELSAGATEGPLGNILVSFKGKPSKKTKPEAPVIPPPEPPPPPVFSIDPEMKLPQEDRAKAQREWLAPHISFEDYTYEERSILRKYTSSGYRSINAVVRKPETVSSEMLASWTPVIADLKAMSVKFTIPSDVVVYRGVRDAANLKGVIDIDRTLSFVDPGFMSVSTDAEIARSFASQVNNAAVEAVKPPRRMVFEIRLKKGVNVIPEMIASGGSGWESEFILPPGAVVKILEIKKNDIQYNLYGNIITMDRVIAEIG